MPKKRQAEEFAGGVSEAWHVREGSAGAAHAGVHYTQWGRLFLGPLPTAATQHLLPGISMQVSCMGKDPQQRVASKLAHVASGSHVASTDVASERGIRRHQPTWWRRTWRQYVASESPGLPHVSSKCVCSRRAICAPPQATPLFMHEILISTQQQLVSEALRGILRKFGHLLT